MPSLTPDQLQKIRKLVHERKMIEAIKEYRLATGVGLAEAKDAVTVMFHEDPLGGTVSQVAASSPQTMSYDNPALEARIQSLLAKHQKIEAIKIYREEYRVGLKEAKDAVDRIEASMRGAGTSSVNAPYEPTIGSDPFENADGSGRRVVILLAVVVALAACGAAVFFLFMGGS